MKNIFLISFLILLNTIIYSQVQYGPFVGAVSENSAVFVVKTYSNQKVAIEYSTDRDFKNSFRSEGKKTNDSLFNFIKIEINNLQPDTKYFYRAIVDNIADAKVHSFKTFPNNKEYNFSFGFGSCQQSSYSKWNPTIFPIIGKDSLRFFIQIGDWTYPDTTEKKYGYRFFSKLDLLEKSYESKYNYNYPFPSNVLSQMPIAYVYDDHDFGFNNSDGSDSNKVNSYLAYQNFFPHYKLENSDNGIWQSFKFGDVEFFLLDLHSQRSPMSEALDSNGNFNPPKGHSILAGYKIDGTNQKDWFISALKNSKAKWKVIVSSVIFNPRYIEVLKNETLMKKYSWMKDDAIDKWCGFPEDLNLVINAIKENNIKNVIVISGDSHSSYIDDGSNSVIPEISASNLDVPNSFLYQKLKEGGLKIWSEGSYNENGQTYGKVSFIFGKENYALLEIIDDKENVVLSYKLLEKE